MIRRSLLNVAIVLGAFVLLSRVAAAASITAEFPQIGSANADTRLQLYSGDAGQGSSELQARNLEFGAMARAIQMRALDSIETRKAVSGLKNSIQECVVDGRIPLVVCGSVPAAEEIAGTAVVYRTASLGSEAIKGLPVLGDLESLAFFQNNIAGAIGAFNLPADNPRSGDPLDGSSGSHSVATTAPVPPSALLAALGGLGLMLSRKKCRIAK